MTAVWTIAAIVLVVGALLPVLLRRKQTAGGGREEIDARARYARLGHYVENPAATADPDATELLRRARERWDSAGAAMADACSPEDFALVTRIATEGLDHVSAAHARIGLPGPG